MMSYTLKRTPLVTFLNALRKLVAQMFQINQMCPDFSHVLTVKHGHLEHWAILIEAYLSDYGRS